MPENAIIEENVKQVLLPVQSGFTYIEILTLDAQIVQPAAYMFTIQSYVRFSLLPFEAKAAILG